MHAQDFSTPVSLVRPPRVVLQGLQHLVRILKFAIPFAIIVWLVSAIDASQWRALNERPKHWGLLILAFTIALGAVCLAFVRWYLLVRSLDIKFSLADAFRLSFLGYLFNFVSAGSVGGDLFKAVFISREQPERKTEAVATVVVDRLIGLFALLLVSSIAILLADVQDPSPGYQAIRRITLLSTAGGSIAVMLLMFTGFRNRRLGKLLGSLPRIGQSCERLIVSVGVYRSRRLLMASILGLSMFMHGMLAVAMFLIASALFANSPPLGDHLTIVPLSMLAGALPLSPSGLGSFEFAIDELYRLVSVSSVDAVSGVLVALVYRLVTIAIAAVGVVYYWSSGGKGNL